MCDHDRLQGGDGYSGTVLHEAATHCPSVYIHRPVDEVMESLKKRFTFPEDADFQALEDSLCLQAEQMRVRPGLHVEYSGLNTESIAAIWEHLLKIPADLHRIERMQKFNVQVNYTNILDSLEA